MKHAPHTQCSLHTWAKPIKPVRPEMDSALDAGRAFVGASEQHEGKPIMTTVSGTGKSALRAGLKPLLRDLWKAGTGWDNGAGIGANQ